MKEDIKIKSFVKYSVLFNYIQYLLHLLHNKKEASRCLDEMLSGTFRLEKEKLNFLFFPDCK